MTDLIPTTAFGTTVPRRLSKGVWTLSEDVGTALASISAAPGTTPPAPFGLTLPGPGKWSQADGNRAFWMSPGQWMVMGADLAETDFAASVVDAAPDARVTEQTDGWLVLDLTSEQGAAPVPKLLEKLVNLDPATLGEGVATRTHCDHMGIFLLRLAPERLLILGMRSAADSLWHRLEFALEQAALSP